MSKTRKAQTAHQSRQEAATASEATAVAQAEPRDRTAASANLDSLLAADATAREPRAHKPRKASAKHGPTFLDEVQAILVQAGRPVKVAAIVAWWCDAHPSQGIDCKGSLEARDTATAARERGDDEAASAADARSWEAARAQAEATTSARLYTAMKEGRLAKAGKGEVSARAETVAA